MGKARFHEVEAAWQSALKIAWPRDLSRVGSGAATGKSQNGKPDAAARQSEREKEIEKQLEGYAPTTFGQVADKIGDLVHLWLNWIVIGGLSLIYSKPKIGKTRSYIRLIKTLWFQEQWPDGGSQYVASGNENAGVLPYDRNHVEIHAK